MKPVVDFQFPSRFQAPTSPKTKSEGQVPTKVAGPETGGEQCPHCHQPLAARRGHSLAVLAGGFRQLFAGMLLVVFALVRCVRFAVSLALCTVGFVGGCCRSLGMRIAHPDDRKILDRL